MSKLLNFLLVLLLFLTIWFFPNSAQAQDPLPPGDPGSSRGMPCDVNGGTDNGLETAIGCIPTNPEELVNRLIKYVAAFAGGVALILMALGAIQMITSGGNPDNLKAGQERFTSAIIGLLFVLFAVTLLQIIGVDILDLPGFN